MTNITSETNYFSLNIKIPTCGDVKHKPILRNTTDTEKDLSNEYTAHAEDLSEKRESDGSRYNFIVMLENVHGCNLRITNPWMNPYIIRKRYKKVRFATLELFDSSLPNCRNYSGKVRHGSLHTVTCPNIEFETVEVLGQNIWQNRQFLMSLSNDQSLSNRCT